MLLDKEMLISDSGIIEKGTKVLIKELGYAGSIPLFDLIVVCCF